jgi:membrane protein required for beta-lactamase induction
MTFIITLISLVIERFFHWGHLRQWRWFGAYQRNLGGRISSWPSWLILLICALPLLLLVGIINCVLDHWLYGLPKIIFGVIVLLYCMGPNNLWLQTFSCITQLHKEDPQIAINCAQSDFHIAQPANSQAFHKSLTSAIFIEANHRVFAVVFWFILLGPVGAVLYRFVALCTEQTDLGLTVLSRKMQSILDWVPARLFTLLFALGGNFMDVFKIWRRDAKSSFEGNDKLIAECGLAALECKGNNQLPEDGASEKAALELLDRVFIMGLLILAMIVIMVK